MGTINNKSRELNQYRIEKFGLRSIFKILFHQFVLCWVRKPEEGIYLLGA